MAATVHAPAPRSLPSGPFAYPDFRRFWAAKLSGTFAQMLLVVVIGWHVYDTARLNMGTSRAAFVLGMVGLAQFLPVVLLTPLVGYVADRADRRHIARASLVLELICALALAVLAWRRAESLPALFAVAALLGVGRAFASPALSALAPNLVPPALLPRAIALNSVGWQAGAIAGPPAGGLLYAISPGAPYAAAAVALAVAFAAMLAVGPVTRPARSGRSAIAEIRAGLSYVRRNDVVFGAISLDLFAVIIGGATALLPVYARDILHAGPEGLGILRAAPALGAGATALWLTRRSLGARAGAKMFWAVALFGVGTVAFGLSRDIWLSCAALALTGAADMVSVNVRSTLIQLHTPDAMRGRVSAVSSLFIGASNELGEFESGVLAALIGPVAAVVAGGVGAVIVAALWARWFPALRLADRLDRVPDSA
jgi:MFS family permease